MLWQGELKSIVTRGSKEGSIWGADNVVFWSGAGYVGTVILWKFCELCILDS